VFYPTESLATDAQMIFIDSYSFALYSISNLENSDEKSEAPTPRAQRPL
jgi:hypothetical protein